MYAVIIAQVLVPSQSVVCLSDGAAAVAYTHARRHSCRRQALLHADESEACFDGLINLSQGVVVNRPQAFQQALAIYCAELIQADRGCQMQAGAAWMDDGFVGIRRCGYFRSDGRHDGRGTVLIADVVLDDKRRPGLLDLVS
jgi:hypothetical protein